MAAFRIALWIVLTAAIAVACQTERPRTIDSTDERTTRAIGTADGLCAEGGYRVNAGTQATVNASGWYRVQAFENSLYLHSTANLFLKIDEFRNLEGPRWNPVTNEVAELDETTRTQFNSTYIEVRQGDEFQIRGERSVKVGYACLVRSHETNAKSWSITKRELEAAERERQGEAARQKAATEQATRTRNQTAKCAVQLAGTVRANLKDPDSMEVLGYHIVDQAAGVLQVQYRAKNSFGAYVVETVQARVDLETCAIRSFRLVD